MQHRLDHVLVGLGRLELFGQVDQPRLVGRVQGVAVGQQALAARSKSTALLFDVALVSGQHLDLLLHLGHAAALLIGLGLGGTQGFFERRQLAHAVFGLGGQQLGALFGFKGLRRQALGFHRRVLLARGPLAGLFLELGQALLDTQAAIDDKTDFRFQPADFGAGFVQLALGLVDLVTGGVMRLANGFQIGLDVAQIGQPAFEVVDGFFSIGLDFGLVGLALSALQKPQLLLFERAVALQRVVTQRDFSLLFELVEVGVELAQDVFDAGQVFTGVRQAVGGLAAALFVLGDTGRFFEEQAQFFRLGLDDAADGALADDGVSTRAQAGAQKHVLHVTPAHRLVVDVVAGGTVAREHALDGDLAKLAPLAAGAVVRVVKHQFDAGTAGRLARVGSVEDHVLHGFATQLGRLALAQHPTHRVHDVRFAATVRPDHADELPRQHEVGGLSERFEA